MPNSTNDSKAASAAAQRPPTDLPESDFLAAEAAAARQNFTDSIQRLRGDLKGCADVAAWARRYPWPTVGVAAALGFLTASVLAGAGRRSKADPAQALSEALAAHQAAAGQPAKPSLWAGLASELVRGLLGILEPVIVGAFSAAVPPGTPADANGEAPPTDSAPPPPNSSQPD